MLIGSSGVEWKRIAARGKPLAPSGVLK